MISLFGRRRVEPARQDVDTPEAQSGSDERDIYIYWHVDDMFGAFHETRRQVKDGCNKLN